MALAACSSGAGESSPASTVPSALADDECRARAQDSVQPLQDFIDENEIFMIAEWNALDPLPDTTDAQEQVAQSNRELIARGCALSVIEAGVAEGVQQLEGEGEVGEAIAAVLRGEDPSTELESPLPPDESSRVEATPEDDLVEIIGGLGEGSTVELAAGDYEIGEPIIVERGVRLVGAGSDQTVIRSRAKGVAVVSFATGDLELANLTIEQVDEVPASMLLVRSGTVDLDGVVLRGAIAEADGGGHGLVLSPDDVSPSGPTEVTATVTDSEIVGNQSAGVLAETGSEVTLERVTITGNGECGACARGSSIVMIAEGTLTDNRVGVQVGEEATTSVTDSVVADNADAGISADGAAVLEVRTTEVSRNGEIGVQVVDESSVQVEDSVLDGQSVNVIATGDAGAVVTDSVLANAEISVQVDGAAGVDLRDNQLWASELAAVSFSGGSEGQLSGNSVEAAPLAGIQVSGDVTVSMTSNLVSGEGDVGISIIGSAAATLADNTIALRRIGVQVGGSAIVDLVENRIEDSVDVGLLFVDGGTGSATGNSITGGAARVVLGGSAEPTFEDNDLAGGEIVVQLVET